LIWSDYISVEIRDLYEIRDYHHAAAILKNEFPQEFSELCATLSKFRITTADIKAPGGNESDIPKKISSMLRPLGWEEAQLRASMMIDGKEINQDTHLIDYVKGRVAFDVEWNSKDQTFDRDLYAFRAFFEYRKISASVLLTRSNDLDEVFDLLGTFVDKDGKEKPVKAKYGASTTHVGKLWPRLDAGRNGGCPVLVFGITRSIISDWITYEKHLGSSGRPAKQSRRKYVRDDTR